MGKCGAARIYAADRHPLKKVVAARTAKERNLVVWHLVAKYCRDSRQQPAGMTDGRLYLYFPNCEKQLTNCFPAKKSN